MTGSLHLVLGDDDFLAGRAVSTVVEAVRTADPGAVVEDLVAQESSVGDLLAAVSPALFGGQRVVVLEQGDWPDYSRARADHDDFELTAGRDWSGNPNRRRAPADYPIEDSQSDISAVLYNAVGGSSVVFAAHWQRNMPSDFRVRSLDGVGDDWPLSYEELEPYYLRVERDFGGPCRPPWICSCFVWKPDTVSTPRFSMRAVNCATLTRT